MLEESPNLIRQIYDVIQHGTVNLDAEQIYKVLLENSCLETQKQQLSYNKYEETLKNIYPQFYYGNGCARICDKDKEKRILR